MLDVKTKSDKNILTTACAKSGNQIRGIRFFRTAGRGGAWRGGPVFTPLRQIAEERILLDIRAIFDTKTAW